jgi:hypothetical protein
MSEFAHFQQAEHSSVMDARAALALYNLVAPQWEALLQAEAQQTKGAQQGHHANPNQHHNSSNNLLMHAHHSYSQPNLTSHAQQQQPSIQLQLHHSSPPRDSHVPMHMHTAKLGHQQSPSSQQQQHQQQQQQHSQPPLHAHPSQPSVGLHGVSGHYHALPLPVSSPHQSPHMSGYQQSQQSHPASASLQYRRPSPVHAPVQLQMQQSPSHLSIGGAHRDGLLAAHYEQGRTAATFGQQQQQQQQQHHHQLQQSDFDFSLRRDHAQQSSQLQFHC